jgi:hypothetical protein
LPLRVSLPFSPSYTPLAATAGNGRKSAASQRGQGVRVISLSIERGLLRKADATARKHGLSRAELIARCLRSVLLRATRQ